jgi:hypothetical protein
VLFNIVDPVGWSVGGVRIEDVALGCLAGIICGVLLWPSGATAQMLRSLADGYRTAAEALSASTHAVLEGTETAAERSISALARAQAAISRLDDAFRAYLAERGSKPLAFDDLTAAANVASKLVFASNAIDATRTPSAWPPEHSSPLVAGIAAVQAEVAANDIWYTQVADEIDGGQVSASHAPDEPTAATEVLSCVESEPQRFEREPDGSQAHALWGVALHVDAVTWLQTRLRPRLGSLTREPLS